MTRRLAAGVGRPSESGSAHGSDSVVYVGGHCVVYDGDGGTTGMEHGALMGDGLGVRTKSVWQSGSGRMTWVWCGLSLLVVGIEVVCPVRTVGMSGLWSMAVGCCSAGSW